MKFNSNQVYNAKEIAQRIFDFYWEAKEVLETGTEEEIKKLRKLEKDIRLARKCSIRIRNSRYFAGEEELKRGEEFLYAMGRAS